MVDYRVPVLEKFQWQAPAITRGLSSPPGGESKGDTYIVKATGSGSWATHDDEIAVYNGSTYDFVMPTEGFILWVNDEDTYYNYDGANWNMFSATPVTTYYPRWILGGM